MSRAGKTAIKALVLWSVLTAILPLPPVRAHLGPEHAAKWNECLGIDMQRTTSEGEKRLNALWKTAQDMIDVYKNGKGALTEYQKIQEEYPWFSWGKYNHRLLFHWGFNNLPKDHPAVKNQVENCLIKLKSGSAPLNMKALHDTIEGCRYIDQATYDKFSRILGNPKSYTSYIKMLPPVMQSDTRIYKNNKINDEALWTDQDNKARDARQALFKRYQDTQAKHLYATLGKLQGMRNRQLIDAVEKHLGIPRKVNDQVAHGAAANALATLIYDIHILHDFDSAAADAIALPPIETLEKDIIEKGMRRLAFGRAKTGLNQNLIDRFDTAARSGRGRSNKFRARELLRLIEEYLPQILQDQYGEILNSRGIYLLPQSEIQTYKEVA
ncbi:hypothetical protein [Pyramidobacter sp.]|uniref:hypothetical protein n=1 Tax=Pyramidobacter sp. TaxID=1943581 RepID=UPI0025EFF2C1|nr:hypothetical protein [Pyramidobacter sp.]MCI7404350.1 hypothetical protein [Pyramidobacter sp.]MDY3213153.1 hypothetical protein [Pyramidobacter sp.]